MNFLFQSGDGGVSVAELQASLSQRETEILRLKEELKASQAKQEDTQVSVEKNRLTQSTIKSMKIIFYQNHYPHLSERWLFKKKKVVSSFTKKSSCNIIFNLFLFKEEFKDVCRPICIRILHNNVA